MYLDGFVVDANSYFVFSKDGEIFNNENFIYDSSKGYAAIKLNPGDRVIAFINFYYPDGANYLLSDNGKSEYFEIKLNHEYKWEQYTDSPNYEPAVLDDLCIIGC